MKTSRSTQRTVLICLTFLVPAAYTIATPAPVARAADTISWEDSTVDLVEGETISGALTVMVISSVKNTGRYVKRWCFYVDDQPLEPPSVGLFSVDYDRGGSTSRDPQSSPGCWAPEILGKMQGIGIHLDSRVLKNGPRAIKIEATVDDDSVHNKTTTVVVKNDEPVIEWTSAQPTKRDPSMRLTANVTSGAIKLVKICLTRQSGLDVPSEDVPFNSFKRVIGSRSDWAAVKCTNYNEYGFRDLIDFEIDTTSWPSKATDLALVVTDSLGQTHSRKMPIPAVDHRANLKPISYQKWGGPDPNIGGWVQDLGPEALPLDWWTKISNSLVDTKKDLYTQLCVQALATESCVTPLQSGTAVAQIPINTACHPNGSYVATTKAVTRSGETIHESFDFVIENKKPKWLKVTNKIRKPRWHHSTVTSTMTIDSSPACSYTVSLVGGPTPVKLKGALTEEPTQIKLTKLKPQTTYTAKVTIRSTQGTRTVTKTFTTPKIPSSPRSSGGGSGSGGSGTGGGYGWSYVGQILSLVPDYFSKRQASSCWMYGYENGALGIWEESNWIVVDQSGYTVYVCKYR